MKVLEFNDALPGWLMTFVMQGLMVWGVCMAVLVVSTLITAPPAPEQVSDDLTFNWKKMDFGSGLGTRWWNSVPFWWALTLIGMFFFVILFSLI